MEAKSTVNSAYTSAGLKGIMDLYTLFPERLRETIVKQHANLFRTLWRELTQVEKEGIEEYALDGDVDSKPSVMGIPESTYYQRKLQNLEQTHDQLRNNRLQEVSVHEPEVATALMLNFENAHRTLTQITKDLLSQALLKESEVLRREQEAILFEPSESEGLVTVPL